VAAAAGSGAGGGVMASDAADWRSVDLRAQATAAPCSECEGTGEADAPVSEPWLDGMSVWDCIWCHGTGRTLTPIALGRGGSDGR
jgi:hypothetical protein